MHLPYRPNVCILLYRGDGKLFLGERFGEKGVWQLPQGGVEEGFSLEENVVRELGEELGLRAALVRVRQRCRAEHQYDFAETPPHYVGKYRGQAQTFWIVEFIGSDGDINLNGEHPEFSAFQWCTPAEVITRAEPRRVTGYRAPIAEFSSFFKSAVSE